MNRRTLLCCSLLACSLIQAPLAHARRPPKLSKKQCKAIKQRMQKIQSRLRQGYSAKQGRRYHERLRELQLKKFRQCR